MKPKATKYSEAEHIKELLKNTAELTDVIIMLRDQRDKAHEHLADVVRKCQYGCDWKICCGICKTALEGLPKGYEL